MNDEIVDKMNIKWMENFVVESVIILHEWLTLDGRENAR